MKNNQFMFASLDRTETIEVQASCKWSGKVGSHRLVVMMIPDENNHTRRRAENKTLSLTCKTVMDGKDIWEGGTPHAIPAIINYSAWRSIPVAAKPPLSAPSLQPPSFGALCFHTAFSFVIVKVLIRRMEPLGSFLREIKGITVA